MLLMMTMLVRLLVLIIMTHHRVALKARGRRLSQADNQKRLQMRKGPQAATLGLTLTTTTTAKTSMISTVRIRLLILMKLIKLTRRKLDCFGNGFISQVALECVDGLADNINATQCNSMKLNATQCNISQLMQPISHGDRAYPC